MKLNFKQKSPPFFELFCISSKIINKATDKLLEVMNAINDKKLKEQKALELNDIEHEADANTHAIYKKLYSSFVTPFDRDTIYNLANKLDDIVDWLDDISEIIVTYKIRKIPSIAFDMVTLLKKASNELEKNMPNLKNVSEMSDFLVSINNIENKIDVLHRKGITNIFSTEIKTKNIIKLKDLYDTIEKCADSFEAIASIIETIIIEES